MSTFAVQNTRPPGAVPATRDASDTLTFITAEGEIIVFEGMSVPVEEASLLLGEEALAKSWNRAAEDAAWRDI